MVAVCKGKCLYIVGYVADKHRTSKTKNLNYCACCACVLPDVRCKCCHMTARGRSRARYSKGPYHQRQQRLELIEVLLGYRH